MVAIMPLGIRALQLLLTIIVLALVGNVIDDAFAGNPSSVNYAIFVAIFSLLVCIFGLVASFVESLAIPIALMVMDGLAVFFTFVAGVVLAAKLGVHSCGTKVSGERNLGHPVLATNTLSLALRLYQPPYRRVNQPQQALPRAPSCLRLFLVLVRSILGVVGNDRLGSPGPEQPQQQRSVHDSGLKLHN